MLWQLQDLHYRVWLLEGWLPEGHNEDNGLSLLTPLNAQGYRWVSSDQLVVGYLVDRHSVKLVFSIVAAGQVVLFALMVNLNGIAALIVSVGFMLMVFGQIPIDDVLVGRIAKK